MTRKTYSVEAIGDLKYPLPFGAAFLGISRPAKIGGVEVHIILPNFTFKTDNFTPTYPQHLKVDWATYFTKPPLKERDPLGEVSRYNPKKLNGGIELFAVKRLVILSRDKMTQSQAQKLLHAIDSWLSLLELWVEVIAKADLSPRSGNVDQHGTSSHIVMRKGTKNKHLSCKHPISVTITVSDSLNITLLQWRKILSRTSNGDLPPESHVFLRDARRMLNNKRYRRSVLDSATATEIALTKLRDDMLASTKPGLTTYIQVKAQQISGLIEFHKKNGQVTLPERIQQEVAEPRNDAIHQGLEPTIDVTKQCLAKAEEVVELAFPLGKLL